MKKMVLQAFSGRKSYKAPCIEVISLSVCSHFLTGSDVTAGGSDFGGFDDDSDVSAGGSGFGPFDDDSGDVGATGGDLGTWN